VTGPNQAETSYQPLAAKWIPLLVDCVLLRSTACSSHDSKPIEQVLQSMMNSLGAKGSSIWQFEESRVAGYLLYLELPEV